MSETVSLPDQKIKDIKKKLTDTGLITKEAAGKMTKKEAEKYLRLFDPTNLLLKP